MTDSKWITYKEAAQALECSASNIRMMVFRGQLQVKPDPKKPNRNLVPAQAIAALKYSPVLVPVADMPEPPSPLAIPPPAAPVPEDQPIPASRAPATRKAPAAPVPYDEDIAPEELQALRQQFKTAFLAEEASAILARSAERTADYNERERQAKMRSFAARQPRVTIVEADPLPALPPARGIKP